jgi:cell shape-determining protein MreC
MKTLALFLIGSAFAIGLSADVRSQAAAPAKTPLQQLQAIQADNAKLLEKQTATLQRLEEMRLQAQQLKAFTARS